MKLHVPRAPRPDLIGAAALGALALALCHGVLAGGVFFERDVHLVWHAQIEAFVRSVAAGSWPVWDPWTAFGQPMLANPSAQVLYPPTWLNLVIQPWTYYSLYVVAHLAFAGIGAYALCRRIGLCRGAALGAAGIWMASGPLLSLVNVWHHFAGAAWMPWVLLGLHEALAALRLSTAALWGATLAGQVLAGSPDMCLMTLLLAAPFALAHLARRDGVARGRRRVACLAVFGLLAAGVAAGQWLPTAAAALGSARLELAPEKRVFWSVHPLALLQLLLPASFQALPRVAAWSAPLFDLWSPFLASLYLGLPASVLALGAFARTRPFRNLFAGCGAFALLFALGGHTPFHAVVLTLLPPLQLLRYPSKAMPAVALCFAVLCGMGIDTLRAQPMRRVAVLLAPVTGVAAGAGLLAIAGSTRWLAGQSAPLVVTAVATLVCARLAWRRPSGAGALIAALAILDLASAHWRTNPTTRRELFTHRPEVLGLMTTGAPLRLHVWDYVMPVPGQVARRTPNRVPVLAEEPRGWPPKVGSAMAMQLYLYPPSAARFGLHGSYDPDLLDLGGRRAYDMNLLVRAYGGTPAYARLMGIGAVDYVLALHDEGFADLEHVGNVPGLYSEPIRVFRVPARLPWTYAVGKARGLLEPEAYRMLLDPSFDPFHEVLLAGGESQTGAASFEATARILDERPDRLRIETDANAPGYLVRVDAYDPGWRASVDGKDAPLLRANVLFRAIPIPQGRHTVEMIYRPQPILLGLGISGLSLAAWATLLTRRATRPAV